MAYHRLLIGPAPAELVTALLEATREANRARPILDLDFDDWEDFVANLAGRRDGRRQWSDTRQGDTAGVGVTWWTDHVGRRHVRVTGAGSHDGPRRHVSTRTDARPPLWHLYPDRVFYRERGGLGEWWGVCGCGVAGRPESIAWMGTSCGPCHDRTEEGQVADAGPAVSLTHQGAPLAPAFSPVGAMLAVILTPEPGAHRVRVHDLAEGTHVDLARSPPLVSAPVFSPDGLLAYAAEYNTLRVHDLLTGERKRLEDAPGFPATSLAFSPDGKYFAAGGPEGLNVWDRGDDVEDWRVVEDMQGAVSALAFAPGGGRLAVGLERTLLLVDPAGGAQVREIADAVPADHVVCDLTFGTGGELCCLTVPALLLAGNVRWFFDEPWPGGSLACVQRFRLGPGGDARLSRVELRGLYVRHLSPCGGHVAGVVVDDNTVCVIDAASGEERGRVGWDVAEHVVSAVFAPDSRTLALVDATGTLKLVPWAALLA